MTLKSFINVFERNGLHVSVKTETTTIDNCFKDEVLWLDDKYLNAEVIRADIDENGKLFVIIEETK